MASKKIQLYTDRDKTIEASPETSANCVILSDGNDLQKVLDNDLTNPTVVHEETSFKVGVGDIDVSSSMVDGEVGRMVIKGQTYQNILPEPSTHVLTNNKEMFKVNEGLDPNVEIVDAVSKSAILKGQTLNNIALTINNTIHKNAGIVVTKPSLYDMAKRYIVMFDVVEKPDTLYMKLEGATGETWKCDLSSQKLIDSVGRYYLISSVSSVQHKQIKLTNTLSSSERCIVTNVNVVEYQEGMENWDIPYFEGMQSVKMPVLTTQGKNLIDLKNAFSSHCTIDTSNNTITGTDSYNDVQFYVTLEKGKTYRFSANGEYSATSQILLGRCQGYVGDKEIQSLNINNEFTYLGETGEHTLHIIYFKDVVSNIQLEEGSTPTPYEPYKSNILSTPEEVVLRSLPNGIYDTLNLNTGEYVQRIGEITFNGSESWQESGYVAPNHYCAFARVQGSKNTLSYNIVCNSLPVRNISSATIDYEGCMFNEWASGDKASVVVKIANSKLSSTSVEGVKAYLQSNPLTIQYELATPVVKTVDLSSSGNWEKIVLDGSEDWARHGNYGSVTRFNVTISNMATGQHHVFSDKFPTGAISTNDLECVNNHYSANQFQLQIKTSRLASDSVDGLKQYLSQNPLTVWYQTATTLDSTQVKQPIFFKDGHIQLSSGVDNSLIPTLDYQAKTSNSYVMDLMKANTRYTMKAKSASGTFTIDGTSYGAGTNGTFTTPTSMTNKLLVMSNKTNEEVMIIEGDVTDKTIPYFKGIKSAFEGEDKIEVLSQGKNLIDETLWTKSIIEDGIECLYGDGWYSSSGNVGTPILIPVDIKQGKRYRISVTHKATTHFNNYKILQDCLNNRVVGDAQSVCILDRLNTFTESNASFVANFDAKYLMVDTGNPRCYGYIKKGTLIIEEVECDGVTTAYEPYKSNSTKIPLLSPLRSLPNGVCDEIVLDRENNKAKIIQRVGKVTYDGTDVWGKHTVHNNNVRIQTTLPNCVRRDTAGFIYAICDKLPSVIWNYSWLQNYNLVTVNLTNLHLQLSDTTMTKQQMLSWLTQNPITVQYELAEPVITEIDLEGFPYIYKDGHIFLNSEIAPVVEIDYNVNQSQLIIGNGETLLRHEQEILDLDKLIVSFVDCEYRLRLLKFDMELSMIALAE